MNHALTPLEIYHNRIDEGVIQSDPGQLAAVRHLDQLHHELLDSAPEPKRFWQLRTPEPETVRGVYLWGSVGTGKTMLMDTFVQAQPPESTRRVHFHRFMRTVHEQRQEILNQQDPLAIIASRYAESYRVICLDEFSVTDITDAMILSGLLRNLFTRGVVLVTTSNSRVDDLYRDGLQRSRFLPAIDLLKMHTHSVEVDNGTDYRMALLRENVAFHSSADTDLRPVLEKSFAQLSDGCPVRAGSISILGRDVETIASGSGVAWFSFVELCETTRSSADYLEIAREFHTVLLSDIPVLDHTSDDAARRFIELIDVLYDHNVNLIASAQRPPGELYSGKRLAAMFDRTVSRLVEMGSENYLARPHLS